MRALLALTITDLTGGPRALALTVKLLPVLRDFWKWGKLGTLLRVHVGNNCFMLGYVHADQTHLYRVGSDKTHAVQNTVTPMFSTVFLACGHSCRRCCMRKVTLLPHTSKLLFLALSVISFLFVSQISWETLNGFMQNSRGRRVWPSIERV